MKPTTIWENIFGTFSKHLFQANPNKWFWKSQKNVFFHRGLNSTGKLHIQRFDTRTLTWKPKIGGLGPCFSILPSGNFRLPEAAPKAAPAAAAASVKPDNKEGVSVRWLVASNLEEWFVTGVTTHV